MKPGGVVSLKKLNPFEFLHNNNSVLIMCLAFVAGILIGCFSVSYTSNAGNVSKLLFDEFLNNRQGVGFFTAFISAFLRDFAVCICFFIVGASVIGVVLSPIFCCVIGLYFGFVSAFAYQNYSLKGIAFNAIVLIPTAISLSVCVFFAAKESFKFSTILLKLTLPKSRPMNISSEFKNYFIKFLLIFVILFAVSIIDAGVSVSFLKFFNF